MGDTWAERIFERFEHSSLQIEVPQIIIHKTDQPDVVVNLLDADGLSSKDLAEINFFVAQTDAATAGDHDGFVVKGIVDVRQPGVGTRGGLVDLRRTFHIQSFVRALIVEDLNEFVEAGLASFANRIQKVLEDATSNWAPWPVMCWESPDATC